MADDSWHRIFERIRLEVTETAKAVLYCFKCEGMTPSSHDADVLGPALRGTPPVCSKCAAPIDIWNLLVLSLKAGNPAPLGVPIGLRLTISLYPLPFVGERTVDFVAANVPKDAQILRVDHSATGPAEVVDVTPRDQELPVFAVRGLWVNDSSPPPQDVRAQTRLLWSRHDADDVARKQLVAALDAISNRRPAEAVIPACVAVEYPLARAIDSYYAWVGVGAERRKSFFRDGATFGHQLNVIAPGVARHIQSPSLPDWLRGGLNQLRKLRNTVAHEGAPSELTIADVAEPVAAAVLGFRYARLLAEDLDRMAIT